MKKVVHSGRRRVYVRKKIEAEVALGIGRVIGEMLRYFGFQLF